MLAFIAPTTPVAAADINITDAQAYDPSSMAGLGLIIDGAAAQLSIGAGDTVSTLVDLRNGGTVDNTGLITRTGTGNRGVVGGIGTVVNRDGGQITASDANGVLLFDGGSVDNSGEGSLIRGGFRGVSIQGGSGTIDNRDGATIESTADNAVYVEATVILTNGAGSTIKGAGSGVWGAGDSDLTIENAGTIEGIAFDGISIANGTVTNAGSGALIRAGDTGIFVDGEGEVTNEDGAAIEADGDGVVMNWGGDVTNRGGATITAGNIGVTIADFGTLTNSGEDTRITATGGTAGVLFITYDLDVDDAHALVNEDGAGIAGGSIGVEFSLDAGGSVSNTGGSTISGERYGIYAGGDRVTVTNSGEGSLIETTNASYDTRFTVFLARGGEVINTDGAKIVGASGDNGIGIYFSDPDYVSGEVPTLSGSVVNGAGSSVTGSVTAIHSLVNTTVDNAGLLDGNVWLLDSAINAVTLHTGSSITGELFIGHNSLSSLTLTGAGEQLYSQAVEGATSFAANLFKTGTGTWVLDRDLETETVTVEAGSLVVGVLGAGSLTGDVTVDAGATLGGSGLIHGDLVNDGAVAPGNSPGVLTVQGDYVQNAGAVLEIELDPQNLVSDRLDVVADNGLGGTATIHAGAVLDITSLSGDAYTLGTRYTVLSTQNGLFGEGVSSPAFVLTGDLTPSAFLTLEDEYDAYNAYVVVRQSQALESAATGANQGAVAIALDTLADADPLRNIALIAPDAASAQALFEALSGEIHADIKGALVEDSRFVREAANRRIRSAFGAVGGSSSSTTAARDTDDGRAVPGGPAIWGESLGMTAAAEGSESLADFDRSSAGFVTGIDAPVGDWLVGLLGGYRHSSYHVDDRASSGSSDTYELGVYAGTQVGALGLRTGAFHGWHAIDTRRVLAVPGLAETLAADYDAATAQLFGELAWRVDGGLGSIEPFLNLAYVQLDTHGFSETGGTAALTSRTTITENTLSTLGARATTTLEMNGATAALHGMLGWQHAHDDVTPVSTFAFDTGSPFAIAGVPIARDALLVEAGLDVALPGNAALGASYAGRIASDAQAHAFKLRFDLKL